MVGFNFDHGICFHLPLFVVVVPPLLFSSHLLVKLNIFNIPFHFLYWLLRYVSFNYFCSCIRAKDMLAELIKN